MTQGQLSDIINIVIEFIKNHNLGQTEFFSISEDEEKKYNDLEKNRLDFALDIVENIAEKKLSIDSLEKEIQDKLQITKDLTKELSDKIKEVLTTNIGEVTESATEDNKSPNKTNTDNNLEAPLPENKKSIFNTLIDKK